MILLSYNKYFVIEIQCPCTYQCFNIK